MATKLLTNHEIANLVRKFLIDIFTLVVVNFPPIVRGESEMVGRPGYE